MSNRELFEKHHLGGNKQTARRNEHGDYVLPSIQDAWTGWDAALTAANERIRELEETIEGGDILRDDLREELAAANKIEKAGMLIIEKAGMLINAEKQVVGWIAHNIASSPAKVLEESILVGQALNHLDKVQQVLLAET